MNNGRPQPPIVRFHEIVSELEKGPSTFRKLAAKLGVSQRTIQRDIEFMRDRLRLPIECSREGTWLSGPVRQCSDWRNF